MGTSKKICVEIQGDLDPTVLGELVGDFDYLLLKDPYGEHMLCSLWSKNYKTHSWGSYLGRMKENAAQNLVLAVMDALDKHGFMHLTCWGGAQIMVRSNEWAATGPVAITGRVGHYAIVDPFWLPGQDARIEIQGLVNDQFVAVVGQNLDAARAAKLELKHQLDKTGQIASYQFKSPEIDTSAMTISGGRKNINIFQNLFLDVASKLGSIGGYEFVGTFGSDSLLLQRTIVPSHLPPGSRFKYLLIDPCFQAVPMRFEIQGDINAEQVGHASAACGGEVVFEETSSRFGHVSWVIPVAKTSSFAATDIRRKVNKSQFYGMKLLSYFHNALGYEPVTQVAADAFLCRNRAPGELPRGQYILIDTIMVGAITLEITGDISIDEVNAAALVAGIPLATEMLDKKDNNMRIGYSIKTDLFIKPADYQEMRQLTNIWQHMWIKFFNKLSVFGWQFKFPYNRGADRGAVFFRPVA